MMPDKNEYDVVVVGSGGGAMLAACRAADQGLSVLIVEKCAMYGGTTAISGGGIWIPMNHLAMEAGARDSFDEAYTYVRACVGDASPEARIRAYLEQGPRMVRYLHDTTRVRFTTLPEYADYFQHQPGAKPGHRSLDPVPFDARRLGKEFERQRPPLPATLVGGRIAMTQTEARKMLGKHPGWFGLALRLMAGYWGDIRWRLRSRRDRRLTLGAALVAALRLSLQDRKVPLWLNSPLRELQLDGGRVTGVVIERDGVPLRIGARHGVILAAGGFEWNQAMRDQYLPKPSRTEWSVTPPHANTGDAIRAGAAAGAALDLMQYQWGVPALQVPGQPYAHPVFVERALPGCVVVDAAGRRFLNENLAYTEFVQTMYRRLEQGQKTVPAWVIFDARFRKNYPFGPLLPGAFVPDHRLPAGIRAIVYQADTPEALAAKIGVDPTGLADTLAQNNKAAVTGVDAAFGKGDNAFDTYYGDINVKPNPCLAAITQAPFYALELVPGDIGTKGGLVTDEHARVLDRSGVAIKGLYAIGNTSAAVMGTSYPGAGATIGPAMVFGMQAADDIAHAARSANAVVPASSQQENRRQTV
ncbi:FAD-dependent oxidoreductase [Herbaspirillum sp. GCM10030257]|uniref:FAD-dependent oxidoreductase n=1 Tax=Herbaspirillum sp. GCM10030257 TaxID=3273393 RepID=UPI00361ED6D6